VRRFPVVLYALLLLLPWEAADSARGPGAVDDLKKIEIICYVPTWLPKGFKLKRVAISYDEPGPDEGGGGFPLYNLEYESSARAMGVGHSFSIDSAREGIGDRNLLETDDSEDAEISSPLGRMFIIYTPKGKGSDDGRKKEIRSNWTSDANMIAEKAKNPQSHPILGRYHGFTATGISMSDFRKIIDSLRPARP
jgi:hypothetical protein